MSFASTALLKARLAVMKIVWRNPNPINRTSFSIVKTLAVEHPDELRVFYRSSRGPGALAPCLSYWSIVTRSLTRHNPHTGPWTPRITVFLGLCKPRRATGRVRNQDGKAKRNPRGHLLRRHGSRRDSSPVPA